MSYFDYQAKVTARLPRGRKLTALVDVEFCDFDGTWEIKSVVEANLFKWQDLAPYRTMENRDVLGILARFIGNDSSACTDIETEIYSYGRAA